MSSNSKWLPAPVALFTDQKRAVRTLPWCLEIGHAPVHPAAHQLTASPASATEPPQQPDPLVGAAIHPDVAVMEAELVADRRWLHTNAELSFEEDATHVFIEQKLRALGLEPTMGLGRAPAAFEGAGGNYHRRDVGTGITADIIGGAGDGPCIALRADIDALPIVETDDSAAGLGGYKSSNIGCMHACGHDAHTAMLLATAAVLVKSSARLKGTIRLIFQPAEEFGAGAKYMVSDGVMEGVDQIYGVHVMNFLETGTIGVKSGPLMAAPDKFSITVQGKGGHGGMPHETVDALLVASMVVTSLQSVVARSIAPIESAVVTVGKMENSLNSTECGCGSTFNVIADSIVMHGTARSFKPEVRETVRQRVGEVAAGVGAGQGAEILTEWDDLNYGYPATINTPKEARLCASAAQAVVGSDGLRTGPEIMTMGGEDFSYFLAEKPGCMVFVGSRPPGGELFPHHHPSFDIDEKALLVGPSFFLALLESILGQNAQQQPDESDGDGDVTMELPRI